MMNMSRYTNTGYYSHHTTSSYSSRPPSRPPSEELCDLHVYRVPHELWRDSFNNILNNVITETVSIGIIRVPYELRLVDVREEIVQQLQLDDLLPRDFVFLRSVGRSLTTLRGKQEFQLKAKHFLPPVAYSPELYILEVTPEIRDALAISDRFSQSPTSRRGSPNTQRGYNSSYRNGYHGGSNRQLASSPPHSVNKYEPLPHISDHAPHPQEINSNSNIYHNQSPSSYQNQNQQQNQQQHQQHPYNDKQPDNATYRKEYPDTHSPPQHLPPPQQQPPQPQPPQQQQQPYDDRDWEQDHHASPPAAVKSDLPRSSDKGSNRRLDDDSGVGELSRSPDDDYNRRGGRDSRRIPHHLDSSTFALDELSEEDRRRRLEEIQNMNDLDKQRWSHDQDERRRQAVEDQRRAEEELRHKDDMRRKEEQDKLEREREERRRKEEEEEKERREREQRDQLGREEEDRRRREEEENERNDSKNDVARFPSPPPLQMSSTDPDSQHNQDPEEVQRQRMEERDRLMQELEQAKADRQAQEKEREECVRKAKTMQHKTTNRRNEARDMWKKKYFEEKKKTAPLEENSNRLRQELEALHRRLMNTLEGPKDKGMRTVDTKPSEKNNYVIQCTKLQHEIEDIQRRVENAKMKLTAEMKLRMQADSEMKVAKTEVMHNRLALKMARNGGQAPKTLDAAAT